MSIQYTAAANGNETIQVHPSGIKERWRDVLGHEGFYRVSDLGRIRSLDRTVPHKSKAGKWGTRLIKGSIKCSEGGEALLGVGLMKIDQFLGSKSLLRPRRSNVATPGERVLTRLFPSRSYGYTSGIGYQRIEQVQHLRNWTYVAVDTIASLLGQHFPLLAWVGYDEKGRHRGGPVHKHRHQYRAGCSDAAQQIYDFRQRLLPAKEKLNETRNGHWDGRSRNGVGKAEVPTYDLGDLLPLTRETTGRYPGWQRHKALSQVQPHEDLEPLSYDHPLRRLLLNPNRWDTTFDLLYELDLFLELCGISYLWAVPNALGEPCELWVIPSHWVWPRTGTGAYVDPQSGGALIDYYEIRPWGGLGGVSGSGMIFIPAEEVIPVSWKSPLSKIDGWSKLTAVSMWIDNEESIGKCQWAQFQNQARPDLFVELPENVDDPSDNAIARMEAKLAQKFSGEYNYAKPIFGSAGMKLTPLGFNPTEMAYNQSEEQSRDKILAAFKLCKASVGIMDSMTYGSILAALAGTCIYAINPRLAMIGQKLTKDLAPRFQRIGQPGDEVERVYRQLTNRAEERIDTNSLTTRAGQGRPFLSGELTGYVRMANGKRRILTDGEAEKTRSLRVWWDDVTPPDPAQVNSDIQLDLSAYSITPNEVRAIRGRPPYKHGGDDPMVTGPGGPMPLPLNTGEDFGDLGELVGAFTEASQPKPEGGADGAGGGQPGARPGGGAAGTGPDDGGGGAVPGAEEQAEPTLEELAAENDLDHTVAQPNGKPSKAIYKSSRLPSKEEFRKDVLYQLKLEFGKTLANCTEQELFQAFKYAAEAALSFSGASKERDKQVLKEYVREWFDKVRNRKPSKSLNGWHNRIKEVCSPGHTAARDGCTPSSGGGSKMQPAQDKSKYVGQVVGKAEHVHSSKVEKVIAKAVQGEWEEDNAFYDVKTRDGKHFLEVKSMLKGGKKSISVHEDALLRKVKGMAENPGANYHTVVVDERATYQSGAYKENYSGNRLYYRRGSGRYSLSSMQPVKSTAELRQLMDLPDDQLPEKARGRLPSGPEVERLQAAAEKAHASRLAKDRARKARLKAEGRSAYQRQT
jgi:phage portal protein BeeE